MHYRRTALISFAIPFFACAQAATPGAAALGPVVTVSSPGEDITQLWANADPTDGRHLIVCGNFSYPELNNMYGYVYSSADGGASWRRTVLDNSTEWVTEENCTYGENGTAYFLAGDADTSTGDTRLEWGHMQLYASHDHGMSWKRAGRRAQGWMDWTLLAALPQDRQHPPSLVVFANAGTDKLGHWWDKRPVALEATDDAHTLSALVAAPVTSVRNFGGGAVTLPDRTALFISGTTSKFKDAIDVRSQLKVFAYSPVDHKLEVRAIVRKPPPGHMLSLWPGLGQDTSAGRFHNRLYATWSDFPVKGTGELWLATSDDKGYHWSARAILSINNSPRATCPNDPPAFADIRMAVSRSGVLGVLRSWNGRELLLNTSDDGGQTFHSSETVASRGMGQLSIYSAIPYAEWWLAEGRAVQAGKSPAKFVDLAHLGLSVRLHKPQGLGDFSLAADAAGRFHAVWAELDAAGHQALMTRSIAASTGATRALLTETATTGACLESAAPLHPPAPTAFPTVQLTGRQELTKSFELHIIHIDYVPATRIATARVVLLNKGNKAISGPLALYAVGLHSDYGTPTALNASGSTESQPYWDLSALMPTQGLRPRGGTQPFELRFKIDHFQPDPASQGDAVAMWVRIVRP